MKPEMILKAELLDILFEDRNKEYGAYTLRKEYNERMLKAMSTMLGLVLLFVFGNYWMRSMNSEKQNINVTTCPIGDSVYIVERSIPKDIPKVEEVNRKINTIKDVVPIIVKEIDEPDPVPTIDQLDADVQIGNKTETGASPTTLASQLPGPSTEAPAAPVVATPEEPAIEEHADVLPEFPGGNAALQRFLLKNLRFDFDEQEPGTRIEIRCRFVVDNNGNVSDAEIIKSAGKAAYDKEVTRVVGKMPQWKPGIKRNKNVATYFTLPVVVEVPEQ